MEEKKVRSKRKLGSFPFLSVVVSTSLALTVLGLFGWMILHGSRLGVQIQESLEVQVYLKNDLSPSDINKIRTAVSSKPYVLIKENTAQVTFTSKDEAAEQFINETGEDFKEFLGDNPLRDLLSVKVYGKYQALDSLTQIKSQIEAISGVFEVDYEESLVSSINQNMTRIGLILITVAVFALLVVIILINNTIKLALFSQRFLIRSMQLVGATGSFIQKPFLIRSVFYGLIAGCLACALIFAFTEYMNKLIDGLSELQDFTGFLALYFIILFLGVVVGYLSSLRAIRKYLKMSLDELY
ncbi:MAG: permease-like cell division protein FtsX [Bacteroidota bacterium]